MIVNLIKLGLILSPERDFGDAFGDDPSARGAALGLPFDISSLIPFLGGLLLLIIVAVIAQRIGDSIARRRLRDSRRGAAEAIYAEIDAALNRALRAPGGYQADRVRELRDLVQARFAQVLALSAKPGKALEGLEKALNSEDGVLETNSVTPAKVKVAMASEEHRLVIWEGVQRFRAYWDGKAHIISLIEAAQSELSPDKSGAWLLAELDRAEPVTRPVVAPPAVGVAAVVADALADADQTGNAPTPAPVKTESDEPPTPPPSPPAPSPKPKGKLPAHKRNMLA